MCPRDPEKVPEAPRLPESFFPSPSPSLRTQLAETAADKGALDRQDGVSAVFDRSGEYTIRRWPDLPAVTPGARVQYRCDHRFGRPPAAIGGTSSYRDGVRWYKFQARALLEETRGRDPGWAVPIQKGPVGDFAWDCRWNEAPGRYVIGSEISDGRDSRFCFLPQAVEAAGLAVGRSLDDLLAGGAGPAPDEAERAVARHLANLKAIEQRFPLTGAGERRAHDQAVRDWKKQHVALRELLAPTAGKVRVAVPAVHLETETQARRPLLLFLCHTGDDVVGRSARKRPSWVLVDWTDPTDGRYHGRYEGVGDSDDEAIAGALGAWDRGNRYPAGLVTYQLPASGEEGSRRGRLATDGKSLGDEIKGVFEWVALGGLVVAGALLLFTPVPALASAALGTSLLSSTAAAGISIGQRWRAGVFDWREDAFDGLTIVSALFAGAGAWARGARVLLPGPGGDTVARVFIGARVGTDLVQGVLVAEDCLQEWTALTEDPALLPEERSRRLMALIRNLAATGLLSYVSLRAAAAELATLHARPRHVPDEGEARAASDKLDDLTNPGATVDATRPPTAEGHTREGTHKTTLRTGIPAHPKVIGPEQTEFATFYSEGKYKWKEREILDDYIHLVDRDRFSFEAKCHAGTLEITVVTNCGPSSAPTIRRFFGNPRTQRWSEILRASELFPKMYRHFEQVGNPVKRLKGMWAWDNYQDAKTEYDRLREGGMSAAAAAKIAVLHARTWIKYHRPMGFTEVVRARHEPDAEVFTFLIVRPGEP